MAVPKDPPKTTMKDVLELSIKRKDVISLSVGEPNFPTPKRIVEAAKKSLDDGMTSYAQPNGIPELRASIARKFRNENGIDVDEESVMVTLGSSEALFLGTMAVLKPGEKTIIPDPGFMDYADVVRLVGGEPQSVGLSQKEFSFSADALKKVVDPKSKIIFMNTPCNPTGTVMGRREMEEIADFAVENDLVIFSDEAYEKYVYEGGKHVSIASMEGLSDRVVTFNTFSKTYNMPGFRLGYCAGPRKIIDKMAELKFTTTVSTPVFLQHAAVEALNIPDSDIQNIVSDFDGKRRFVVGRLGDMGLEFVHPMGAFYVFCKTPADMGSMEFTKLLLDDAGVMVVPGDIFGRGGEGWVRISYATSEENLSLAMDKIDNTLSKQNLI